MLRSHYRDQRQVLTQGELNAILLASTRPFGGQRDSSRVQLARLRLDGLDLSNRNLTEADLSGASLVSAVAYGTNFTRANLHCSDLRDCDLSNASLVRAEMRGALVCGANLAFARLDGADLRATTVAYRGPGAAAREKGAEMRVSVDFPMHPLRVPPLATHDLTGRRSPAPFFKAPVQKRPALEHCQFPERRTYRRKPRRTQRTARSARRLRDRCAA